MSGMRKQALGAIVFAICIMFAATTPALSYRGDKEGWSIRTDYASPRAFLTWVPLNDGPRVLELDCVPGGFISLISEDVEEGRADTRAIITLTNGRSRFDAEGEITRVVTSGETFFQASVSLRAARERLIPALEGPGPITYELAALPARKDATGPGTIPVANLAQPLGAFKSVCFGIR
jgi:hypothetical protein